MRERRYDFEKLEVYQKAIEFSERVFRLTEKFPMRVQTSIGDQFRRASLSICNNIAEGSRKTAGTRRQYYGYALDSTRECVPMIELAFRLELVDEGEENELSNECFHIGNMLYRLLKSVT